MSAAAARRVGNACEAICSGLKAGPGRPFGSLTLSTEACRMAGSDVPAFAARAATRTCEQLGRRVRVPAPRFGPVFVPRSAGSRWLCTGRTGVLEVSVGWFSVVVWTATREAPTGARHHRIRCWVRWPGSRPPWTEWRGVDPAWLPTKDKAVVFPPCPTQSDGAARPRVPRRRLHQPRRLDRGPPLAPTLGRRRQHRSGRRETALRLAPPPRPRPRLPHHPPTHRRPAIPPPQIGQASRRRRREQPR